MEGKQFGRDEPYRVYAEVFDPEKCPNDECFDEEKWRENSLGATSHTECMARRARTVLTHFYRQKKRVTCCAPCNMLNAARFPA